MLRSDCVRRGDTRVLNSVDVETLPTRAVSGAAGLRGPRPLRPPVQAAPSDVGRHAKGVFTGAFDIEQMGDYYLLRFSEQHVTCPMKVDYLERDMRKIIERAWKPRIVVDFKGVHSVCSSVLGVMVKMQGACRKEGGEVRVASIPAELRELFKITRIHKIVPLYASADAATRHF